MRKARWPVRAGILAAWAALGLVPTSLGAQVDTAAARGYMDSALRICRTDGGALWGVSLCGPMVIGDAATGTYLTSQPPPDADPPVALGYANAPWEWGGERWAMYVWDFLRVQDERTRNRVLLHELFHVIQPELDLLVASAPGESDHLQTPRGRYWLQLEWRALADALGGEDEASRRRALRDALAFRQARRLEFPGATAIERVVEMNEGLAQYTATVLVAPERAEAVADAVEQLEEAPEDPSFLRTFGYPLGTAYGLLLDEWRPGWREEVGCALDLAGMVAAAAAVEPSSDATQAAERYGGPALWQAEQERERARQERIQELRRRFVEGPVVVVPRGQNASHRTAGVVSLPQAGTIYPDYRVTGEWGSLEAEQVLVSPDQRTLTLPGPADVENGVITGDGWTVRLERGWKVKEGPRPGDLQVGT